MTQAAIHAEKHSNTNAQGKSSRSSLYPVTIYLALSVRGKLCNFCPRQRAQSWVRRTELMSKTIQKTWEKLACGFRDAGWERNGKMGTFFKQEESLHFNSVLFKRAKKRNICRWGKMGASVFKNKKKSISNKLQNNIPNWFHVSIIKLQNNFNCSDFHFPLSKG